MEWANQFGTSKNHFSLSYHNYKLYQEFPNAEWYLAIDRDNLIPYLLLNDSLENRQYEQSKDENIT